MNHKYVTVMFVVSYLNDGVQINRKNTIEIDLTYYWLQIVLEMDFWIPF